MDRLFIYNLCRSKLSLISDYDFVSHYCWIDSYTILSYMCNDCFDRSFYYINIKNNKLSKVIELEGFSDGHPSFHKNRVVFDTYPNAFGTQYLHIFDFDNNSVKKIAEFSHSPKYNGPNRCDLHPRFSSDGKSIYFDSIFTGTRSLYKFNVF